MSFFGMTPEQLAAAMASMASGNSMWEPGCATEKSPRTGLPKGEIRLISQDLADEVALIAQKYTGYFYGHPTRAGQYGKTDAGDVYVDYNNVWTEPVVFPDDCEFCQKTLSDERVIARVEGFQEAIDREVRFGRGKESFPLTDLPLYLKRRMCVEWNHAFKSYLEAKPFLYYDFEERAIKEVIKADERTAVAAHPEQGANDGL